MSNSYGNNQCKIEINYHYPLIFFFFRNDLLFHFKICSYFDETVYPSWTNKCFFVLIIPSY
jgi:hypothetical protein